MSQTIISCSQKPAWVARCLLPITKSDYLQYLACAPEFWYSKHYADEFSAPPDEVALHTMNQGNEIEKLAREYFKPSEELQILFQCNFKSEQLLARADIVLTETKTGHKTLIEVKSGSEVKAEYLHDLSFQVIAAKALGITFDSMGVLHVNSAYTRTGPIQVSDFFTYADVTAQVLMLIPETKEAIKAAIGYLAQDEPKVQLHEYCGQKLACPVLQKQHPNLPDYSVFQISRIHQSKLRELLANDQVDIHDVPPEFNLSEKQRLQVNVAQSGRPHICQKSIRNALDCLQYPLYFLDYETLQYGIPLYDGVKPYQQMAFQWSLHVLPEEDSEPLHLDFLSDGAGHPAYEFAKALCAAIPTDGGSILVWNKSFETSRNKELAQMYPQFAPMLLDINDRVFDLMEIFQQQHYVHPAFKGSYSIKQVLPVLVPHLSYASLEINHGMLAAIRWFELITGWIPSSEKESVLKNLKEYCKMDTLAMLEVYHYLRFKLQ